MSEPATDTVIPMEIPMSRADLVCLGRRDAPRHRLLCVPYAGAGASAYRTLPSHAPDWLEVFAVRLPAREDRIAEQPLGHIRSVVDAIVAELDRDERFRAAPFSLYGHSMGALVCFELARTLRRRGLPGPVHLAVSGRRAPSIPDDLPSIHRLPPARFLEEVCRLGGIPEAILTEPGLLDLIVPALRADFAVCETYRHAEEPPLSCPISAFGGRSDPTTTERQLGAWREETTTRFRQRFYPGDHFFVHAHAKELFGALADDLDRLDPAVAE